MRNKRIYKIKYCHNDYGYVDIKANSEEEALNKCSRMFDNGRLRKFDINEQWSAVVESVEDISDSVIETLPSKLVQSLNEASFAALEPSLFKNRFESLMDSVEGLLEEKEKENVNGD